MPTTKRRYPVTETDDIAAVLDEAARRWPDVPRSRLIQRVLMDWHDGGASPAARHAAAPSTGGIAAGVIQAVRPGR